MLRSNSAGWRSTKRDLGEVKGEGTGVYCCFAKVYLCFSRARDLLKDISFFFKLIGFKELRMVTTRL
jgi:hypothetical protein